MPVVMLREEAVALVGRIYEAAAIPEFWPGVLGSISRSIDGVGACLFTPDGRWIASEAFAEEVDLFISRGWLERDTFNARLEASGRGGFVCDLDLFRREEIDREPVYADWLHPRGLGWGASSLMRLPHERTVFINVERRRGRGPVETPFVRHLNQLHPHIARAAMISSHLALERTQAASSALQMVGVPAALLRPGGRVEHANGLFLQLQPQPVRECSAELVLANARAQAELALTLAEIEGSHGLGRAIALPAQGERGAYVLHVMPVRGAARDVFSACTAMVLATPVVARPVLPADLLVSLFDLTPAEARVAHKIAAGATVETIAETLGVSRETVRSQLKAALAKVGLTRQAELVGLLASIPAGHPRMGDAQ